jgi:hypothetical protein
MPTSSSTRAASSLREGSVILDRRPMIGLDPAYDEQVLLPPGSTPPPIDSVCRP